MMMNKTTTIYTVIIKDLGSGHTSVEASYTSQPLAAKMGASVANGLGLTEWCAGVTWMNEDGSVVVEVYENELYVS